MGFDYFIFYTEASVVCILILLMLLINARIYSTKQEKQVWFDRAVTAFIIYFVSDACWAAIMSGMFTKVRFFVVLFNFTNYVIISLMVYAWFMFMAASEKMTFQESKMNRLMVLSPSIISSLFIVVSYLADPYYWINEQNELNNLYYVFMLLVPNLYLIAALVVSLVNAKRAESQEDKKHYLLLATFPFGVMAFGLLQLTGLNAPTFCFGCTIMWLWFYIQNMQASISVDDLTKLNNRGQINRYMEQLRYKDNTRVYIMMIDVDRFKGINDTYGHAEGDRALILVSDVLKRTCENIKASAFLGRFGGDEFTIIIQNPGQEETPRKVVEMIRRTLLERVESKELPYELEVSIGFAELSPGDDTMHNCMIRADQMLYQDKQRNKS